MPPAFHHFLFAALCYSLLSTATATGTSAHHTHILLEYNNSLDLFESSLRRPKLLLRNQRSRCLASRGPNFACRKGLAFQPLHIDTPHGAITWIAQLATGLTTYVGFVFACDRPRGQLVAKENDQIQVRKSSVPGAGLGVFATKDLPKEFVLGSYPGVVLPIQTNLRKLKRYPECEAYIWRFSDSKYVIDPTNAQGQLDLFCSGGNDGQFLSVWLFEQTLLGSLRKVPTTLCRINEPPLGNDVNVVTEENTAERYVLFRLERDIVAGEELFIDYGLSYDRSTYGSGSAIKRDDA